ncbi:MAG TPA: phosphatase PAP2 family protein [Candidatus Saccharimonadales bacterium]|nr:phosphatase PAP2 family protein [Candidatus Saccharimonadales bacterium]
MLVIKARKKVFQALGGILALLCVIIFIANPSFPTPDKLIFFLFFVFMAFGQATEGLKRFGGFIILILVYESFRSIATQLNSHVNYTLAPSFDRTVFGNLPTVYLQKWLWHGKVVWYDFVLYVPYFLHFVIPLGLGILVWKTRDKYFWQVMNTYLVVAFAGFLTFLLFPAAPPWLASQNHYIQPIVSISTEVWNSLGIHNFPSIYNHLRPNPVAAIPSEHAAWAILLPIFVRKLYGYRWAILASIYPLLIIVGTMYEGEHYFFDIVVGVGYAIAAYKATPKIMDFVNARFSKKIKQWQRQALKA